MNQGTMSVTTKTSDNAWDHRGRRGASDRNTVTIESTARHKTILRRHGNWIAANSRGHIFHTGKLRRNIRNTGITQTASQKSTFVLESLPPLANTMTLHNTPRAIMARTVNEIT